jgi:hypothetical protein
MQKLLFIIFFLPFLSTAQSIAVNNDGTPPHASAMLDVKSTSKGILIPRLTTAERTAIPGIKGLLVFDNTTSSFWFHNGTAWTEIGTGSGSSNWNVNGTNIYNTNTGNVGIGTNAPSYDLHIYRNDPSVGFYDANDNTTSGSITGDSTNLVIAAYRRSIVGNNEPGNLLLQVNTSGFPGFVAGNVGIGTSVPNAKLHINSNVMIGSGNPAAGYLLSVNGKIISEEVRVELDADWPDYVFKKGYQLPSLAQVEKYIRRNGHLKNIPSAKTVAAEGFELGDMNRRLLEKVEELTLYLIQQNKEMEVLKREMKLLKAKKGVY